MSPNFCAAYVFMNKVALIATLLITLITSQSYNRRYKHDHLSRFDTSYASEYLTKSLSLFTYINPVGMTC